MVRPALAMLLMVLCAGVGAQTYRWVDAQGVTHFGDRPPPGTPADTVRTAPSAPADPAASARIEALRADIEKRAAERAKAREEAATQQAASAARARECAQARANLKAMESARRVVGADGTGTYGDDRLALMARLRASIAEHCD